MKRIEPGPGQESVWDYPRPPILEPSRSLVRVVVGGVQIVGSARSVRVLETSHPPVYYVPQEDVVSGVLRPHQRRTFCEFKGVAAYCDVVVDESVRTAAAWYFPEPAPGFEALCHLVAFYPSLADACFVDDELVEAQPGDFYGGWITKDIVGPFKGAPGTRAW